MLLILIATKLFHLRVQNTSVSFCLCDSANYSFCGCVRQQYDLVYKRYVCVTVPSVVLVLVL